MVRLARLLSRVVGLALVILLAAVGVAAAVFCISGGHGTLSLASLASDIHLPQLRDAVGSFLQRLRESGPVAVVAAIAGAGAVLAGIVLLVGSLTPTRERLLVLEEGEHGVLSARRRALARAARVVAEDEPEVARAQARARSRRRRPGGHLAVRVVHPVGVADDRVVTEVDGSLRQMVQELPVRYRVRARAARRSGRGARRVV